MEVKKHILIVEDDRATMLIYKKMLQKLKGWQGSFRSNFDDAIHDILINRYDIVISDGMTASSFSGEFFLKRVCAIAADTLAGCVARAGWVKLRRLHGSRSAAL